jgi:hypothetical protein
MEYFNMQNPNTSERKPVDYGLAWLTKIGEEIGKTPYSEIFSINPDDARAILARSEGKNFREPNQRIVSFYARMMREGKWHGNSGAPIVFSPDGVMTDGQHRLRALLVAGITLDFDVRFNGNRRGEGLDENFKRTDGAGVRNVGANNGNDSAAIARLVIARAMGVTEWCNPPKLGRGEIESFYLENSELMDITTTAARGPERVLSRTFAGWLYFEAHRAGMGPRVDEFLRQLATGADLSVVSPVYWLRERLVGNLRATMAKLERRAVLGLLITAWNKFIDGGPCKQLRWEASTINAEGRRVYEPLPEPRFSVTR